MLGPKRYWVQKNFVTKKNLGKIKFLDQKHFGSKRIFSEKIFRSKKNLGQKQVWVQKHFDQKLFLTSTN